MVDSRLLGLYADTYNDLRSLLCSLRMNPNANPLVVRHIEEEVDKLEKIIVLEVVGD